MQLDKIIARIELVDTKVNPAVVLGLGINGLGIVRSLGRMNIPVIGIYTDNYEVGRFSRYCNALFFPSLSDNLSDFKSKLLDLGKKLGKKSVLLPQNDMYVNFMSDNRRELEEHFLFLLPSKPLLNKLIDKREVQNLALENGLEIPETYIPRVMPDIEKINQDLKFPAIIKPFDSFSKKFPDRRKVVQSNLELSKFFSNYPDFLGKTVVQEVVGKGDGFILQCNLYLDELSQPLGVCTVRKVRQYPPNFGVGTYVKSEKNQRIIDLSVEFLQKIGYVGPASLEFIHDENNDKYVFVELNPRYPMYHMLCTDDGVNLPFITYIDNIDEKYRKNFNRQKESIEWITFYHDRRAYFDKNINRSIKSHILWIKSIIKTKSYAWWSKDDLLPFIPSTRLYQYCYRPIWIIKRRIKYLMRSLS